MKVLSQHARDYSSHGRIPMQRKFPSQRSQYFLAHCGNVCIVRVHSNRNRHKEERWKEGCQGNEEGHARSWLVCGASIDIFFYVQKRTKSRKLREGAGVQAKGVFACMHKRSWLVGGVLGQFGNTCLKTVWEVFRERNV